jgi:uroporphyrinogen decarboxylase
MRDFMTPKERLKAIAEKRPYDRIPHAFGMGAAAAKVTGIKISEYYLNPQKQIDAGIAAYKEYGLDGLTVHTGTLGLAGVESVFPDYSEPLVANPISLYDDRLKNLYTADIKNHPAMRIYYQVLEGLWERAGDEVPLSVLIGGPFSAIGRAVGTAPLLRALKKDPAHVHDLMRKMTDAEIAFVESLRGTEIGFTVACPVSSGTLISPEHFREFSKPYLEEIAKSITRVFGRKPVCHICGNTRHIIRDMVEIGSAGISIDNMMDLVEMKKIIGKDAVLIGNVDPAHTMLLGSPEDAAEELRQCLIKAWDAPGGYAPGFGCGLPVDTPAENIHALLNALRKVGQYPFNPENFL